MSEEEIRLPPREAYDEFRGPIRPFAVGSVVGARCWNVSNPKVWEAGYREGFLRSTWAMYWWKPGLNTAECMDRYTFGRHETSSPELNCGCGFWAYYNIDTSSYGEDGPTSWTRSNNYMILGVVRGYGKTILGELGFRCEKAEILALMCDPYQQQYRRGLEEYNVPIYTTYEHMVSSHSLGLKTE